MLGKRSRPTIGKLAGVLRSGIVDTITSPRSPLDCRVLQSPRGQKFNYYNQHEGGIGLGIVVTLDTSSCNVGYRGEIIAKYAICSQFSGRSNPINVNASNKNPKNVTNCTLINQEEEIIEGLEEEFTTYVTCHGPTKSTTKVYYSGGEYGHHHHNPNTIEPTISNKIGVFNISPAVFSDDYGSDSDFLSSCHLCRKPLHGKDIYMYRGEKAFCSSDCRQKQMKIDERKEKCRSNELSTSPYSSSSSSYTSRGQIFSTGIVAV